MTNETKRQHRWLDIIFMLLPFILMALSLRKSGNFDITTFEAGLADFRNFDFGMSNYLLTHVFNNPTNVYLLFSFDIMIYYVYWKFIDLAYSLVFLIIDFAREIARKITEGGMK